MDSFGINYFLETTTQQMSEAFKSQNVELFKIVVFEIDGKKLYSEKLRLSVASPTFNSMLSDRWNTKDEPIKITGYKYDDFKEFITCLYAGYCNLNDENIFTMLDIAEFYQVEHLKNLCDEYLVKMDINFSNVFEYIKLANKYSLGQKKFALKGFIRKNISNFLYSNEFLNASKADIYELINLKPSPEYLFKIVYEWSENQASKRIEDLYDKMFNNDDEIKAQIAEFLPYFKFKEMPKKFLVEFVDPRKFIFSDDEINDLSDFFNPEVKVKITNVLGQSIHFLLSYKTQVFVLDIIRKLRFSYSKSTLPLRWKTFPNLFSGAYRCRGQPRIQTFVKWYLVYSSNGCISVRRSSAINYGTYYVLAEMENSNDEFVFTEKCQIAIME